MTQKGFTLIELLIVVAIIGILAAIAVPNFLNAQTRAKVSQTIANFKALSTAMNVYSADTGSMPLHDPAHNFNIWHNALTTPISYIARIPRDIFQTGKMAITTSLATQGPQELHPEPFYTTSSGAWGNRNLDKGIPNIGEGNDLTLRFIDDPELLSKARSQYYYGRYIVSVGPDQEHTYPGTYNASNGLSSRGDMIWVCP